MNLQVTATLHMTKDGQEYVSNADLYSVATYAYSQLGKANAKESLKALCANLLRYGKEAQLYKNYCTDNLPDANLTDAQKAYLTDLASITFDSVNHVLEDLNDPTVTWVGKSLILDSKVTLKFVIDARAFAGDPTALRLRVIYKNTAGEEVTAWVEGAQVYQADKNRYSFDFDGLLAAELRSTVSVAIFHEDTRLSTTQEYSVSTYGNGKNGQLLAVCQALMAYSDLAKAFFAS